MGVTIVSFNQSSLSVTLKVPSGQIGSAWAWGNWIGLKKDIDALYVSDFFILILNIWEEFKFVSRFIQKLIQPPACWDHGLFSILSSCWLSHFYMLKKSAKYCSILVWIADCWFSSNILQAVIPRKTVDCIFGALFGRKNRCMCPYKMIQPVIPTRKMIRGIFVWSGSELWSLFKYSKLKLKNWKPIEVDVLFYAYLMVPLTWRSNLAGRYL